MSSILQHRGISGREGGQKSTYSRGIGLTAEQMGSKEGKALITMDNVHNLSLFELRQSLKSRGEFEDNYEGAINFEILLARMIALIGEDKLVADASRLSLAEASRNAGLKKGDGSTETLQEKLGRQKLERKREAEGRSKARVADKAYFKAKEEENLALSSKEASELAEKKVALANIDADTVKSAAEPGSLKEREGEGGGEGEGEEFDPFKMKNRAKIGGKFA